MNAGLTKYEIKKAFDSIISKQLEKISQHFVAQSG